MINALIIASVTLLPITVTATIAVINAKKHMKI